MKRYLILFFVSLCLLFPLISQADEKPIVIDDNFSIRNGIRFGMTIDEIAAIEQQNGNNPKQNNEPSSYKLLYEAIWEDCLSQKAFYTQMFGAAVANSIAYDWTDICVETSIGGVHCYATYDLPLEFNTLVYISEQTSNSMPLTDMLRAKYGEPQCYATKAQGMPFFTRSYRYLSICELYKSTSFGKAYGWLLKYNDTYVFIEAYNFSVQDGYKVYYEVVAYNQITFEEYDEWLEEQAEKQQRQQDSINTGL